MGFDLTADVSLAAVFIQGILSFLSPCVLPLIPLYMGYLAGGTQTIDENGKLCYKRSVVMLNTLCFIIGISFAFFLLGLGFTAVGQFFSEYKNIIIVIGGILIILFGLIQLGVIKLNAAFTKERRFNFNMNGSLKPLTALVFGFVFSFAWTPCVGPALTSVLLMTSSADTMYKGIFLIGVYTLGFVIPFILLGLFTTTVLEFIKKNKNIVKYTVKIGGALLILMGLFMIFNVLRAPAPNSSAPPAETVSSEAETPSPSPTNNQERELPAAIDFNLPDQNGEYHSLSDYAGKTIFLNFWATWCGPCQREMPDIQALYEEYGSNQGDVIILGVANPKTSSNPNNSDVSTEEVIQFINDNGYTYPTIMDTTGELFYQYGISSFPTTFMITKDGLVYGYISGMLEKQMMIDIINQTIEGSKQ